MYLNLCSIFQGWDMLLLLTNYFLHKRHHLSLFITIKSMPFKILEHCKQFIIYTIFKRKQNALKKTHWFIFYDELISFARRYQPIFHISYTNNIKQRRKYYEKRIYIAQTIVHFFIQMCRIDMSYFDCNDYDNIWPDYQ